MNLTNQSEWLKCAWNVKRVPVLSTIDEKILDPHSYSFFWDFHLPPGPLTLAREEFDIAHGLCFVFRQKQWYELIAFGAPKNNYTVMERYFNFYHEMQAFILSFRHAAKKLIDKSHENRIILPTAMRDKNQSILLSSHANYISRSAYPTSFNSIKSHITSQEFSCLQQLALGYSLKEIANILNLSARTVETYLNRVKNRFNIAYRKDLVKLANVSVIFPDR